MKNSIEFKYTMDLNRLQIYMFVVTMLSAICLGQPNFDTYDTVDQFQCNFTGLPPLQRIVLTQRCGEIISACFPDNYPAEIPDGYEIWDLNAGSAGTVLRYRFVINVFEANTGNLDISSTLIFDEMTNINSIPALIRNITLTGSATTGSGVVVDYMTGTDMSLNVGDDFSIFEPRIYLTFESSRNVPGMGFNISYCAELQSCQPNPCTVSGAVCSNTIDGFDCTCPTGFTGDGMTFCDDVDECTLDTDNCDDNAGCTNIDGSFTCTCNTGYTGNGVTCSNVNECTMNTDNCNDDAMCADTTGSFTCTCNEGFVGDGVTCEDIDECTTDRPCDDNASCTNTEGSFICTCTAGYTGDGTTCRDIDECTADSDNCDNQATCTNTEGSFTCACNPGLTGAGTVGNCEDVNECTSGTDNCDDNAVCTDNAGSFTCACNAGYTGNGVTCDNIDECAMSTDNCNDDATCDDTIGSFTCTCNAGFVGDGVTCEDVDECTLGTDNCDDNAVCTNNDGSFTCACNTGYTGNGVTCSNVNECTMNTDNCNDDALCTDTTGSFTCACNAEFVGDGVTCEDRNECVDGTDNCDSNADCTNTRGSFTCACQSGFMGDGVTCTDIDECTTGTDDCHTSATCTNTDGSFRCACNAGFTGDGRTCTDVNECLSMPCDSNADCTNDAGSFSCVCRTGYTGNGITCTDINECDIDMDLCNGTRERCMNTDGSYMCICDDPTYRGSSFDNCAFYCEGFNRGNTADCLMDGFLEWPFPHNGVATYDRNQIVSWNVNLTGTTAIRFTFVSLSLATPMDYIIFSNSPEARRGEVSELAVFSGSSLNAITNLGNPATSTNPVNYNNPARTFIVEQTQLYVHFISDRNGDVSTGFVIAYERDVDNCPSPSPCQNGGMCLDQAFTYICDNCPGYTGQDCDEDIDECAAMTDTCDENATCTNTMGSFTCTCNPNYTGDGNNCDPLIIVSNLNVMTESSDATTTVLIVNFDINEPWRANRGYVVDYIIMLENLDTGNSRNETTLSVDNADFLPFTVSVTAFNSYRVSVLVGNTGTQFASENAQFQRAAGSESVTITSASIAPRAISDLTVLEANSIIVQLNWTNPDETDRGATTGFEIGYIRNGSDCSLFRTVVANPVNCDNETPVRITTNNRPFILDALQQYRIYELRIRAYTDFGSGDWSNVVTEFIGNECDIFENRVTARATPCSFDRAALRSPEFPSPSIDFDDRFAQVDFSGKEEFRLFTDFFSLAVNDFLDVGPGPLPVEPALLEDVTGVVMLTEGAFVQGQLVATVPASTSTTAFFGYRRDRLSEAAGFLVYYETNADRCTPNPCANGATCAPASFNFVCTCTSGWGGEVCNTPMISISDPACTTSSPNSFTITWNVNSDWDNDATVFSGIQINHDGLDNPIALPINARTYTFDGFNPYALVNVIINGTGGAAAGLYPVTTQGCRTAEAPSGAPGSINVVSNPVTSDGATTVGITVTWNEPTTPNGVISGYQISYTQTDATTFGETALTAPGNSNTLSVQFSGLRPFRSYTVSVIAVNGAGNGTAGVQPFTTPEGVPQGPVVGLTASPTARTATLTFSAPTIITGNFMYDLTFTPDNGNSPVMGISSGFVVDNLTPATEYTFTVVARTSADSGPSIGMTTTTLEDIPGPIGGLSLNPVSFNSIACTWTAPAEPNGVITTYRVVWVPTSGGTPVSMNAGTTSFTITSLTAVTEYSVSVFASTAIGEGDGVSDTATTPEGVPQGPVVGLTASSTARNATLTFSAPTIFTGNFMYDLTFTPDNGNSPVTGISSGFVVDNLTPATEYTFTVVARTSVGSGPPDDATITTLEDIPGPIGGLSLNPVSFNSIACTWTAPAEPNGVITTYRVVWVPTSGGTPVSMNAGTTSFTITSLTAVTEYSVSVFASTAIGEGDEVSDTATTPAGPPIGPVQGVTVATERENATITIDEPEVMTGPFTFDVVYYPAGMPDQAVELTDVDSPLLITGLTANVIYNLTVYPRSADTRGDGFPFSRNFLTLMNRPSPVQNFGVASITATGVMLNWNEPLESNGATTNYTVTRTPGGVSFEVATLGTLITDLNPFTTYTFSVVSFNAGGISVARILDVTTAEAAPSMVENLSATVNADNTITVTFDPPSTPNGVLRSYAITVQIANREMCLSTYGDDTCNSSSNSVIAAGATRSYTTPVLAAYRTFEIAVVANTSAGNGQSISVTQQTNVVAPGPVINVVVSVDTPAATSAIVSFTAPSPVTGPSVTYTVTATSLLTNESLSMTNSSSQPTLSVTFLNLEPNQGYAISVAVSNSAGSAATTTVTVELARVPQTVSEDADVRPMASTETDLQGGTEFSSFNIENPCQRSGEFFVSGTGTITSVEVIMRQEGAAESQNPVVWSLSITANPNLLGPYIAAEVSCNSQNRKKRQLSADESYFTVGADSSCSESNATVCNGPLPSGRRYLVAYRGSTTAGQSGLTLYGPIVAPFANTATPRDARLQPGEIAAIVIGSVIAFLLLILLIVFIVRRRNTKDDFKVSKASSTKTSSKAGQENPVYAQVHKPAPQHFEMSSESLKYSEQTTKPTQE